MERVGIYKTPCKSWDMLETVSNISLLQPEFWTIKSYPSTTSPLPTEKNLEAVDGITLPKTNILQLNITVFSRKYTDIMIYIFKWMVFHCHVCFPGCSFHSKTGWLIISNITKHLEKQTFPPYIWNHKSWERRLTVTNISEWKVIQWRLNGCAILKSWLVDKNSQHNQPSIYPLGSMYSRSTYIWLILRQIIHKLVVHHWDNV